ncbi:MAG TPA: CCA tRNA nucleotidyltransferase [Clostridiales bacterium]|nr:CCA tRNA nucleotidyltransferase [Clostridiales bacterium]
MKIKLPDGVNDIINVLIKHGYEAYAVGGCVRDSILNIHPEDWDITTSAKPEDVKEVFRRTVDTGIKHGTVTVLYKEDSYEVTTYRIDGEYEDNRHPKSVEFTSNLANDLRRRDFTINAMAYNKQEGLVDLYKGMEDLKKGIIRCVGNPVHRFEEDALRILRAFRFSAQLNFKIEEESYKAACLQKENLRNISAERIRTELNKLILSSHPEKLIDLYHAKISKIILPEFDLMMHTKNYKIPEETVGSFVIKAIQTLEKSDLNRENDSELILRWTLLLHELEGTQVRKILKKLKFDNNTIEKVSRLIRWIHIPFDLSPYGIRKAINEVGIDIFEELFIVKRIILSIFDKDYYKEKLKSLNVSYDIYKDVLADGDCIHLSMLKVDGRDLINIGYKPGKELGRTLNILLDLVLKNPSLNKKLTLLEKAKEYLDII